MWILQKLSAVVESVKKQYLNYNIVGAKREAEGFFWHVFCDDYLEIIKRRIYNEKGDKKISAQYILYQTLLAILKMMAPITPFITEEIYQNFFKTTEKDKSIHISEWPSFDNKLIDEETEGVGDLLVEVISAVRKFKSENNKSLKEPVKLLIIDCKEELHKGIESAMDDLKAVTKAEKIEFGKGDIKINEQLEVKVDL